MKWLLWIVRQTKKQLFQLIFFREEFKYTLKCYEYKAPKNTSGRR